MADLQELITDLEGGAITAYLIESGQPVSATTSSAGGTVITAGSPLAGNSGSLVIIAVLVVGALLLVHYM